MAYLTFISHSGEDSWVAEKLSADCRAIGANTFLDEAEIAVGARFEDEILTALRGADELLVLITPWALTRAYVWLEIGAAWGKGIPIVILLLGISASEFQEKANIPIALKGRSLIALNNVDRYLRELQSRVNGRGV